MKTDKVKKTSKAHTRYKLEDGTIVAGVTTVVGLLNKPYLIKWANNLGLEGIDSSKYTDEAASIGTLAHAMIQSRLTGEPIEYGEYSAQQIDLAENAILSFLEWEKHHELVPVFCEKSMVSEDMKYGGTIDCYCMLDGKATLLDFKTGKDIYDEYFVQLSAYRHLLEENNCPVEQTMILRVGRTEDEGFDFRSVSDTSDYFEIFKNLLNIYYIKKKVGWK